MTKSWMLGIVMTAALAARAEWKSPTGSDGLTRIVVEAEAMKGVAPASFGGTGTEWRVGRAGLDPFQGRVRDGRGQSRTRTAMTDAGDNRAELVATIHVPSNGTYSLQVKYECDPSFNAAFELSLRRSGWRGRDVFRKTCGRIDSPRLFNDPANRAAGLERDAVESYAVPLEKGRYKLTLSKTANPEPAGMRSIDAVLLTSHAPLRATPDTVLDELRRANHRFIRFRLPAWAPDCWRVMWRLAGQTDREALPEPQIGEPVPHGQASAWLDIGRHLPVERASVLRVEACAVDFSGAKAGTNPPAFFPFAVDVAPEPADTAVVKSFSASPDFPGSLEFLLQPDLNTEEGRAWSRPLPDLYRALADDLDREVRKAEGLPVRMRFSVRRSRPDPDADGAWAGASGLRFRQALGLNAGPELAGNEPEERWSGVSPAARLDAEFAVGRLKCDVKYDVGDRMRLSFPRHAEMAPGALIQDVVGAWGQNVKDVRWCAIQPDGAADECGLNLRTGLPLFKVMRRASDMAALTERWLEPARAVDAAVALLLSGEGRTAREAHRNAYAALRRAGYRVDLLVESDARTGYLPRYKALAVCSEIRDKATADAIAAWTAAGGVRLCATNTAGLAAELAAAGIRPDIRADKPGMVCNRLTGPEGTVVTVVNLNMRETGSAEPLRLEIDDVTRVGRVWSYAYPEGLEAVPQGNTLTVMLPRVEWADVVVIEK